MSESSNGPMVGQFYRRDLVKGVSGGPSPSSVYGVYGGSGSVGRSVALSSASYSRNSLVHKSPPQLALASKTSKSFQGLNKNKSLSGVSSQKLSNIYQLRGTYYGRQLNSNKSGPTGKI